MQWSVALAAPIPTVDRASPAKPRRRSAPNYGTHWSVRGAHSGKRAKRIGLARGVPSLLLLLLATSCGYTLVDYQNPPEGLTSVSIQTFSNQSYEPGIELVVADALRREFLRRGAISVRNDPANADLVLTGKIGRIRTRSRTFSSVALALEYDITLELDIVATLRDGTVIPVEKGAMRETERYLASADVEATRKNREEALRKLSAVLAVRTHDMLYEVYQP
jgi:outer membrane lipopolysaccharide assembly protein LptE/RlpB